MGRRKAGMKIAMIRRRINPPIALAVRATLMPKMDASAPISTLPICPVLMAKPWAPKDAAVEVGWAAGEEDAALHCGETALEDAHGDEDEEGEEEPGGEGEGEEEDGHAEAAAQEDSAADFDAASQQSYEEGAENEAYAVGGGQEAHEASADV